MRASTIFVSEPVVRKHEAAKSGQTCLKAILRSGADWKPICFCQRHSLTRFGFGGERWQGDHRRPEPRKYREG